MKTMNLILVLLVVFFAGSICHANVYTYQDENGAFHFTNIRPPNKKYRTVIYSSTGQNNSSRSSLSPSNHNKKDLMAVAKTYLGTPYKLGGDMTTGIDCSGFVKKVFSAFDVKLPRTAREQFTAGTKIDKEELTTGDLIFFRRKNSDDISHVGIFMEDDKFIHASTRNGGGVRIDSLGDSYYRQTFIGASRVLQ
ncbi:MAG: Murein DD-endopeptidase MepS/Murein LD-carboxypeptidase precursor [Syntrophorhabdus sp. PtaU1.Bin002]|nr:MAG: Murein DD-endopeptidase MepS/Murein LD-carboxypeptidase precursor [Syntrophorhabdus sp. PtaU1.Bin002]